MVEKRVRRWCDKGERKTKGENKWKKGAKKGGKRLFTKG